MVIDVEGVCAGDGSELGAIGKVDVLTGRGCGCVGPAVCRLGGGGGGASFLGLRAAVCSSAKLSRPTLIGNAAGSNGGGSFLGVELDADVDRRVE